MVLIFFKFSRRISSDQSKEKFRNFAIKKGLGDIYDQESRQFNILNEERKTSLFLAFNIIVNLYCEE